MRAVDAEAENLRAELDRLAYAISHDLRAPLRAVSGYAVAIDEDFGPTLDGDCRRQLAIVASEAERAMRMLDALLMLSRLGRQALDVETLDMMALAREAAENIAPAIEGHFTVDALPPIRGDRSLVRAVWSHLLANASIATRCRANPRIDVSARRDGDRIVYEVRDNGVGFDMAFAGKLFGTFQKLHHVDVFPGLGASLAVVERIVARHGGNVWADAALEAGANFSFSMPAEDR